MNPTRSRSIRPSIQRLEDRHVLSGPAATWLGQDGRDFVGPYPAEVPDGVQDVHIQLTDLPTDRAIQFVDLNGLGGGRWQYGGPYGPWKAALVRPDGSATADLFIEPDRVETGRPFHLVIRFDDGSTADIWFDGGSADPNLRMPEATLEVAWVGQDGSDRTGLNPGVGPDGLQDVRLNLSNLAASTAIESVRVTGPLGRSYRTGLNHSADTNAELVRSADGTSAALYFQPDRDLTGQLLTVEVVYATGKIDTQTVTAGSTTATLKVAAPAAPPATISGVSARWVGQGLLAGNTGWAGLSVAGLPAARTVVGATLSGTNHNSWTYRAGGASFYSDPYAFPLNLQRTGPGTADLSFPPDADLNGDALTLRLAFDDGTMAVVPLTGGSTDPGQLSARPASTSVVARPGDDLNALARQYGRIELSAGTYRLTEPLVLPQAVTLIAPQGGATLRFAQPADAAPWSAAIKIHAGNTTLDGFAVRFDGPVRWRTDVDYGAAVIGTTDNLDRGYSDVKANLALTRLDVQGPPATTPGEEAVGLIRLSGALGGRVEGNTLQGGTTRFLHGPWRVVGNTYRGAMPDTWAWEAFAGHFTHDLVLKDNSAIAAPGSGRTWRFLVLTGTGDGDLIEGNVVRGIGPRETDTYTINAAEMILTEAYSLRFEGTPLAISGDGRILQIPSPQGNAPGTGDVVAILTGPNAGQYRRIAQAIGPSTFLMADPLPAGTSTISIGSGFSGQTYRNNTLDLRGGGSGSAGLVLVGNHYGLTVQGNTIQGGGEAIRLASYPSEQPVLWGWSHNPVLGAVVAGNTIEDSARGLNLTVMQGPDIKTNFGRVYLAADVRDNRVTWTDSFAAALTSAGVTGTALPPGIVIGDARSIDPGESQLRLSGNLVDVAPGSPSPAILVRSGQINGEPLHDTTLVLTPISPGAPTSLTLVNDTGSSATDGLTRDARLRIGPTDATAVRFEYRVGDTINFLPISDPTAFLPASLSDGNVRVAVRSVDARGRRSPETTVRFTLDTNAPAAAPAALAPESDSGRSNADRITSATVLNFLATGDPSDRITLLRNGQEVVTGGPGTLTDRSPLGDGVYQYTLRREDAAGNRSTSAAITVIIDRTAPLAVTGLSVGGDNQVSFTGTGSTDEYSYRVNGGAPRSLGSATRFTPEGLVFGSNTVDVLATDAAGNTGVAGSVTVAYNPTTLSAQWQGQDGRDLVGPYPVAVPDGVQDIHLVLGGLPTNRRIAFVDVQGLGGSRWQFGGPWGPWKAALIQRPSGGIADLYLQPDRFETGRPFEITLRYVGGGTATIWVNGGTADPTLKMPRGRAIGTPAARVARGVAAGVPAARVARGVPAGPLGRRG